MPIKPLPPNSGTPHTEAYNAGYNAGFASAPYDDSPWTSADYHAGYLAGTVAGRFPEYKVVQRTAVSYVVRNVLLVTVGIIDAPHIDRVSFVCGNQATADLVIREYAAHTSRLETEFDVMIVELPQYSTKLI